MSRARPRGQAVAELALALPLFLVITVGVLDVARLMSAQISLTNAVREAALYASTKNHVTHWCADNSVVPCPVGAQNGSAPNCAVVIASPPNGIRCPDPDNIAYIVSQETSGLDRSRITLSPPTCIGGTCDTSSATAVTIRASYVMNMVVPIVSAILGGSVTIRADATVPMLR